MGDDEYLSTSEWKNINRLLRMDKIIDYLERDWKLGQLTQCNTYTPRYGGSIPEVAYSGLLRCNTRAALKSCPVTVSFVALSAS